MSDYLLQITVDFFSYHILVNSIDSFAKHTVSIFDFKNNVSDLVDRVGDESTAKEITNDAKRNFVLIFGRHITISNSGHRHYRKIKTTEI